MKNPSGLSRRLPSCLFVRSEGNASWILGRMSLFLAKSLAATLMSLLPSVLSALTGVCSVPQGGSWSCMSVGARTCEHFKGAWTNIIRHALGTRQVPGSLRDEQPPSLLSYDMRVLLLLLALLQGILSVAAPTDDKTRQWEKRQTSGAAEAEQLFIEALKLTGYEIPAGTNLTDLATRLVHFNGCSSGQKKDIYEGWQDSWKMMDEVNEASKIDFNTGAAIDYLGPPLHIVEYQDVIRDEPPLSCCCSQLPED